MGGRAGRTAFFEALFKKRRESSPIDFGFFLLRWDKQSRKAQQRRSGAEPAERSKATLLTAKGLSLARQQGPARCRTLLSGAVESDRRGQRQSGRPERRGEGDGSAGGPHRVQEAGGGDDTRPRGQARSRRPGRNEGRADRAGRGEKHGSQGGAQAGLTPPGWGWGTRLGWRLPTHTRHTGRSTNSCPGKRDIPIRGPPPPNLRPACGTES